VLKNVIFEHNYKACLPGLYGVCVHKRLEGVWRGMLGFLFSERECRELDYLLRKELDEMIFDLKDGQISGEVRMAIELRYKTIFRMYARLASPNEISRYARNRIRN
jgi:hypothetical protein